MVMHSTISRAPAVKSANSRLSAHSISRQSSRLAHRRELCMEIDIGHRYSVRRIVHSARPATKACSAMPLILSGMLNLFLRRLYSQCRKVGFGQRRR